MTKEKDKILIDRNYNFSHKIFADYAKHLNQLGKIQSAKTIMIKPNFAAASHVDSDSHAMTDLRFLRLLIESIRVLNEDADILIAESDSTDYGFAFIKFKKLGINKWKIPNVRTLDLSRDVLEFCKNNCARYFNNSDRQMWLSKAILKADYFISTANIKTHSITRYSGACKNLFGLIPDMNKEQYHTNIDDVIHDINLVVKVNLSIVDGFCGMEKNGPINGSPINLGFRVFSTSPFLADKISCETTGINYRHVKHLKLIENRQKILNYEIVSSSEDIYTKISEPVFWLRFFNFWGLKIQAIGGAIYYTGHRIHCSNSPLTFIIALLRPMLIRIFKRETLKKWKNLILN